MKKIFILPVIVILFFVVLFVVEEKTQVISQHIPIIDSVLPSSYDCAKEFDKLQTLKNDDRPLSMKSQLSKNEKLYYGDYELMENRCLITIKSWADQSDFEYVILGANLEREFKLNQLYLEEIPCTPITMGSLVAFTSCESIKEQREGYANYLKSK